MAFTPFERPAARPIRGRVMVLTGATSGIGLVTARKAAAAGARLFLIARDGEALARTAEEIGALGAQVAWAVADVGDLDQVEAAAEAAVTRFGGSDVWENIAGVAIYADLLHTPRAEHERLFQTNYWG